jgi:hypothetical protein
MKMSNLLLKKNKLAIFLTVIAICLACFGSVWMVQAQAAGKYITKVEGTYTSSLTLLKSTSVPLRG